MAEGEIAFIRRVWADGQELDLTEIEMRVYRGDAAQQPDPLIEAKQGTGNAPAYRGTAYVVFERIPLDTFGNRLPQFEFEVVRPVGKVARDLRAVALISQLDGIRADARSGHRRADTGNQAVTEPQCGARPQRLDGGA
ncbi:hypothetical protein [Ochrobactrum sp. Q0168]|uniref:hypothetical protein n=1 Tax=Ochrobactrum sp. Q0168 TaxID=2793241 RepID=UPI001FFFF685